jgi:membrane fusion protein (multidrug efflux system)
MAQSKRTRRATRLVLSLVIIGVAAFAVYEGLHWYQHVFEPNAKIEADFIELSSSVNGTIEQILVRRGDKVSAGQKLASMDSSVAELEVLSLQADIERERATRRQVEAELAAFQLELTNKIATALESIKHLRGESSTLVERWTIARTNVDRNTKLLDKSMVARQRIDDANDKLLEIKGKRQDLQTTIRVREKQLEELEGTRIQEDIYQSRIGVIDRTIDKTVVRLQQSQEQLNDMHVYSPVDGLVNEVYVSPGSYVEDGDQVFLVHDPRAIWIQANIDESDIRHVATGQRVVIDIDAYPFEHFAGTVRSIGQVTSAVMTATAPSERTGGGQRIPVLIDFPPIGKTVWPGMRVAVNIVVR